MKKASNVLLLIGGILDIVLGGVFLLFLIPTPYIFSGIFALVSRKKDTFGYYVTTTVFATLGLSVVTLTGAIFALIVEETGEDPFVDKAVKDVESKPVQSKDDLVSKIKEYKELLDMGAITEEEYTKLKEVELKKVI